MAALPILAGLGLVAGGTFLAKNLANPLPSTTPYDVVVNIDSLSSITTTGWEIRLKQVPDPLTFSEQVQRLISFNQAPSPRASKYEVKNLDGISIGVVGLYNRGKTWFINQLFDTSFKSSTMIHTEGLSMVCPQSPFGKNLVVFDTAGSDFPIPEEGYIEKKATEAFLRELVINLSSVLFIVVNRLRLSDQAYFRDVVEIAKKRNKGARLVLVHNLNDVTGLSDVEVVIEKEIKGCFNKVIKRETTLVGEEACTYYQSTHMELTIDHFIMAREGSQAGAKWNKPTKQVINSIVQATRTFKQVDLFNNIIEFSMARLPELLVGKDHIRLVPREVNGRFVIIEDPNENRSEGSTAPQETAAPDSPAPDSPALKVGTKAKISEGIIFTDGGGMLGKAPRPNGPALWQPLYNLYTYPEHYLLVVEVAGIAIEEINISPDSKIRIDGSELQLVRLTGQKARIIVSDQPSHTVSECQIPLGEFSVEIPVPSRILARQISAEYDAGLCYVTLPRDLPGGGRVQVKAKAKELA